MAALYLRRPGPEPPYVGAVYVSARGRSGRRWEAWSHDDRYGWRLHPMGDDVHGFGGVKGLWRSTDDLRDRKRWKFIAVTSRAARLPDGEA